MKRILSILLLAVMIVGVFGTNAIAEADPTWTSSACLANPTSYYENYIRIFSEEGKSYRLEITTYTAKGDTWRIAPYTNREDSPVWVKRVEGNGKTVFTVYPKNVGTAEVVLANYHYNPKTNTKVIRELLVYKFEVSKTIKITSQSTKSYMTFTVDWVSNMKGYMLVDDDWSSTVYYSVFDYCEEASGKPYENATGYMKDLIDRNSTVTLSDETTPSMPIADHVNQKTVFDVAKQYGLAVAVKN